MLAYARTAVRRPALETERGRRRTVIEVEITKRDPFAGGRRFDDSGAYERIAGVLTFAVDPENKANRPIVDAVDGLQRQR